MADQAQKLLAEVQNEKSNYRLHAIRGGARNLVFGADVCRRPILDFKERVYSLATDESPEQLLVAIAEKEFGLAQLHLPPAATPIVQRLDAPDAASVPLAVDTVPVWPAPRPNRALDVH